MKRLKEKQGITLIALVITIIILLILAGVALSMLSGENGILKQAAKAKKDTEEKSSKESATLTDMEVQIDFSTEIIPYKFKNGYLTGISVKNIDGVWKSETVSQFKEKTKNKYAVYKNAGEEAKDEDNMATGMVIKINTTQEKMGIVVVYGDTNGDGKITAMDVGVITNFLIKSISCEDYKVIAMDTNSNNIIEENDKEVIKKVVANWSGVEINQNKQAVNVDEITIEYTENEE